MDSILFAIPLLLGTLLMLLYSSLSFLGISIPLSHILTTGFFALSLFVLTIDYRKYFPAWSFPWLGVTFVYFFQIFFVLFTTKLKLIILSLILFCFLLPLIIYLIFRSTNFENALGLPALFLLPIYLPSVFYGTDEMIYRYKIPIQISVGLFSVFTSFLIIQSGLKLSYAIALSVIILYTFSYFYFRTSHICW